MIAELSHFALFVALIASGCQAVLPLYGSLNNSGGSALKRHLMGSADLFALVAAASVLLAFAGLVWSFVVSDFSVALVASHSHSAKPLIYKISGTWGNHEGSLLLWIVILVLFSAVLSLSRQQMAALLKARVLAVQGIVTTAFLAFSLFTSNPFERLDPAPVDGRGLNPILQDIGLALHPPMLYLGYVGLSMAFSFAVAGLINGQADRHWARAMRPWVSAAWCALTLGIALGSWWAYYELGWGGWWFWDPVENASLMPWLAATALLHSILVVEKTEQLKSWTILLAIMAFSLSLVGTFIVRSGLLTSVHSFASDPARGVFILGILLVSIGIPLLLFAWRGPQLASQTQAGLLSREAGLIANNFLLTAATLIVLIGTFYPLGLEVATGARITVGPPYFEATFTPVMGLLVVCMAGGPLLVWRAGILPSARTALIAGGIGAGLALVAGAALSAGLSAAALAGLALIGWLALSIIGDLTARLKPLQTGSVKARLKTITGPVWGMWIAHFGMVVFLAGALGEGLFQSEVITRVKPGDTIMLAGRTATFTGIEARQGPNYQTETAIIELSENGRLVSVMAPEKRFYPAARQTTTEAAIRTRLAGDDYMVLGDGDAASGYTLRLYHKPLVSFIWLGAVFMAIGALTAIFTRPRGLQTRVEA